MEITAKFDVNELRDAWENKKDAKPNFEMVTSVGVRTDLGSVRENNEDKFDFFEPLETQLLAVKGCFYAVADGMGGHAGGQIASEMALKMILRTYYGDPDEDVPGSLGRAFAAANSLVYDTAQAIPGREGMGTTCTALVLRDDRIYAAHVGDSRLYLLRDGEMAQLSQDHSWVAEQVRRGSMSGEEAEMSPFKNVITKSIGTSPAVEPDLFDEDLLEGDVFLLCSDGLTGFVKDKEIQNTLSDWSPAMASMKLIDMANERGGGDNITVVIVSVEELRKIRKKSRLRKFIEG